MPAVVGRAVRSGLPRPALSLGLAQALSTRLKRTLRRGQLAPVLRDRSLGPGDSRHYDVEVDAGRLTLRPRRPGLGRPIGGDELGVRRLVVDRRWRAEPTNLSHAAVRADD